MEIGKHDIFSLIPQRPPFVMVDRLLYSDEKSSRSSFVVSEGNLLVENGFFTEAGLAENIAQTCAAQAGFAAMQCSKPVAIGYIGAVKNLRVFALPKINDRLETEITIENQIFEVTLIKGVVRQ